MIWILWIIFACVAIFFLEYMYRIGHYDSFLQALPTLIIPMLIGQMGLFYGYRLAPSFLLAAIIFTLINQGTRPINIYLAGEHLTIYGWLAILCVVVGVGLSILDKYAQ